jgi:hypothetical protein
MLTVPFRGPGNRVVTSENVHENRKSLRRYPLPTRLKLSHYPIAEHIEQSGCGAL